MTCVRRHFEARQRPEAPECWRHLNTAVWPEVCSVRTKYVNKCEQRINPEQNAIILLKLEDIQPYQFESEGTFEEEDDSKWLRY